MADESDLIKCRHENLLNLYIIYLYDIKTIVTIISTTIKIVLLSVFTYDPVFMRTS